MKSLQEIWEGMPVKTDKGNVHSYLPIYEKILAPYRDKEINVLEIGIFGGASLLLWEKYFTKAKVYGMDCSDQPHGGLADLRPLIAEGTHNIIIGDATDEIQIKDKLRGLKFSVIWDDGNHTPESQLKTFTILKDYLAENAIFIIEDFQIFDDVWEFITIIENIYKTKQCEVIDLRHIKGRYDDILILITDKQ